MVEDLIDHSPIWQYETFLARLRTTRKSVNPIWWEFGVQVISLTILIILSLFRLKELKIYSFPIYFENLNNLIKTGKIDLAGFAINSIVLFLLWKKARHIYNMRNNFSTGV